MPKNPQWLFSYWEMSQDKINELKGIHGEERGAGLNRHLEFMM